MNRLEEILRAKRGEIESLRPRQAELDRQARERSDFRSFRAALNRNDDKLAVIAEIKKASPSAGVIAMRRKSGGFLRRRIFCSMISKSPNPLPQARMPSCLLSPRSSRNKLSIF
jgi:hypothetical protein